VRTDSKAGGLSPGEQCRHLALMSGGNALSVYITCMARRNYVACGGHSCDAVLSGHSRSLLAQFGLTPKFRRGLAASDPGETLEPLNALWTWGDHSGTGRG